MAQQYYIVKRRTFMIQVVISISISIKLVYNVIRELVSSQFITPNHEVPSQDKEIREVLSQDKKNSEVALQNQESSYRNLYNRHCILLRIIYGIPPPTSACKWNFYLSLSIYLYLSIYLFLPLDGDFMNETGVVDNLIHPS